MSSLRQRDERDGDSHALRRRRDGVQQPVGVHDQAARRSVIKITLACLLFLSAIPAAVFPESDKPEIRVSDLERRVHDLINKEREEEKLTALAFDERLSTIARAHSRDMARRNFFSHVNPDGRDPTARGKLAGYACRKEYGNSFTEGLAENLFQGSLYSRVHFRGDRKSYDWNTSEEIAKQGVKGWMSSPGHRRNILQKNYSQAGVGVAISA